jgi:hypothetical protein
MGEKNEVVELGIMVLVFRVVYEVSDNGCNFFSPSQDCAIDVFVFILQIAMATTRRRSA